MKVSILILSSRPLLLINIIYYHSFIYLFIYCKYAIIQHFKQQVFYKKTIYLSIYLFPHGLLLWHIFPHISVIKYAAAYGTSLVLCYIRMYQAHSIIYLINQWL